jgi:multidrug resistance efflux pump
VTKIFAAFAIVVAIGIAVAWARSPVEVAAPFPGDQRASAPGRVEGRLAPIEVRAAIDGIIASLDVDEGAAIEKGDVIARIDCRDLVADAAAADAHVRLAAAMKTRLLRGGRDSARREAQAAIDAAGARLTAAQLARRRAAELWDDDKMIPRERVDATERDARVAEAELRAAHQRAELAAAEALPEEVAAADEAIAAARWAAQAAHARTEKCNVRSPIDGMVLRVPLHSGERATAADAPLAIISDMTTLRVRAEVDERDVGRVRAGQPVVIEADALGNDTCTGIVTRVAPTMGRRKVQSGDPAEKADRDVREVLVDVNGRDPRLIAGLRVVVLFERATAR